MHLRTGLNYENISLLTEGEAPPFFFNFDIGQPVDVSIKNNLQYSSGYAYIVHNFTDYLGVNLGARYYFHDNIQGFGNSPSIQASVSVEDPSSRHKVIIGAGYYQSLVLPEFTISNDNQFVGKLSQYAVD